MTAGAIIACSIAASRALAPIEVAIANWRGFVAARQSARRLDAIFSSLPTRTKPLLLQPPTSGISIEGLAVAVPGTQTVTLSNITFAVKAGSVVAVIGPSAAGKSTLARALTGVAAGAGAVRSSMVRRTRAGRPRNWASTSAIYRKTCSCSMAPLPRTSRASKRTPTASR